jgi:chromate transport protein ChrA
MPLKAIFNSFSPHREENETHREKLSERLTDVFMRTWDLGFTAFGGPPVHFQILHRRFVEHPTKRPWMDEQMVIHSLAAGN